MGKTIFICKLCREKYSSLDGLYSHLESEHGDAIPEDMCVEQFYYFLKTGKEHGKCVECGKPTLWNDKTKKYKRFCEDPECMEKYKETVRNRMIGKYGKVNLLNDPEQQRKMLMNRKISGLYDFNGVKIPYVGSYELDFLKTMDLFLDWDPTDIIMPSPHNYYYMYNGEKKFYIPDVFIPSLGLEIEIKDGGDNPNMHHKIQDVDKEKERLKDEVMSTQKIHHYIKITNKNYYNLFDFFDKMKEGLEKYGDYDKIPKIIITEDIKTKQVNPKSKSLLKKEANEVLKESINDTSIILEESIIPSPKSLNQYKKIDINNSNINKYKSSCKGLSHIRTGDDYKGYIYIDGDNVVGFYNIRKSDKYLQGIEVNKNYQSNGLGRALLMEAIKDGVINLSVNKKNVKAINMYKKLFKIIDEDKNMYYMKLKITDYIEESLEYVDESYIFSKDDLSKYKNKINDAIKNDLYGLRESYNHYITLNINDNMSNGLYGFRDNVSSISFDNNHLKRVNHKLQQVEESCIDKENTTEIKIGYNGDIKPIISKNSNQGAFLIWNKKDSINTLLESISKEWFDSKLTIDDFHIIGGDK